MLAVTRHARGRALRYSADVTSGETFSASSTAQAVARAFDDSQATCWSSDDADTAYVQVQFAAAKTIRRLVIKSGSDGFGGTDAAQARARHPNAFTLKSSATGAFAGEETTHVTEAASFTWSTAANESRTWDFSGSSAHAYWRLTMTGKQEAFGATYEYFIAEIEMMVLQ